MSESTLAKMPHCWKSSALAHISSIDMYLVLYILYVNLLHLYLLSLVAEGDSIVGILSLKDKMQMHREIDSLDIVNTVNVDTSIEKNRNDASMNTTELLIQGLLSNNDISKGTMDTALSNLRNKRAHMDRQHDEDYKREMKKLYKKISAKNRVCVVYRITLLGCSLEVSR